MTCICPTRAHRKKYLPTAIACFQAQTYQQRELLILQDGNGEDLGKYVPNDSEIRWMRYPSERYIGQKRNACCEAARGDIIAHWDDDDWSHPERLAEQIVILKGNLVTGYRTIHFLDDRSGQAHEYHGTPQYAVGTSLCYWKSYWREHQFREFQCGEDNDFVMRARGVLSPQDGLGRMVALTHDGGTSPRSMNEKQWRPVDISVLPWRPR